MVATLANQGVERDLTEEPDGGADGLRQRVGHGLAPAGPEDLLTAAVGQLEPGHVLDDADHPLMGLQGDGPGPLRDLRSGLLGRGDDDDLGVGDELGDRDRDVSGARRQVEEQDVEVAPEHVTEELLQRPVEHRSAPDDGLVAGHKHPDRNDLHLVRDGRQDHVVDLGRALLDPEHPRDREAVDVSVDDADPQALLGQGRREVDGDRRLADATLAGGHGIHARE